VASGPAGFAPLRLYLLEIVGASRIAG